jgi:hypothetical protein
MVMAPPRPVTYDSEEFDKLDIKDGELGRVSDFEVRPEELAAAGARTSGLAQHVRELLGAVQAELAPSGELQADAALAEMLTEFQHGLGALSAFLGGYGSALDGAAEVYAGTEDNAADAARRQAGD